MILKDNDGDVGIALAVWEGLVVGKAGVKGVPGTCIYYMSTPRSSISAGSPARRPNSEFLSSVRRSKQGSNGSGGDKGDEGESGTF